MVNRLSKIAKILQYSVPVAGSLWLTLHTVQPPAASQKVIVVGAGASGIAAASHLKNAGFDVTILEARNRTGGRIWTDYKLAKYPVELGAEFIHGSEVLTWKLLKQHNLKARKPIRDKQLYAHMKNMVDKFDDLIPDDWEDDIWECAEEWVDEGEPDTTLRKMLDFEKWLIPHDSELARLMNNLYACDYGADLSELGMYGLLEASYRGDADEDGDYPLEKGYTALIEKMAKGLDIRLNTPVQSVNYTAPTVTITDTTGNAYTADRVIITLPLAILQSGDVEFIPAFSKHKLKAIHGIGAAKVNKVILGFKNAFWKKKMAMLLTPLDTQIWWRPGYDPDNGDTVLTALIGGESGAHYSQLSEAEAVDLALKDLQQIFGTEAKKAFKWGRFVNWGADPYSKMGYSYNPVGAAGLRQALSENIADRVYFAGEATNTVRPATVHGAIESGWRAAKEIIASANRDK